MLTEHLRQSTCIDACDGGYFLTLQPGCEALTGIPVGICFAIIGNHQCLGMNLFTLHKQGQTVAADARIRYTVVAYQWIGGYQYLTRIAGVCQTFWIARHRRVEHHLTCCVGHVAKRPATELGAILKY